MLKNGIFKNTRIFQDFMMSSLRISMSCYRYTIFYIIHNLYIAQRFFTVYHSSTSPYTLHYNLKLLIFLYQTRSNTIPDILKAHNTKKVI